VETKKTLSSARREKLKNQENKQLNLIPMYQKAFRLAVKGLKIDELIKEANVDDAASSTSVGSTVFRGTVRKLPHIINTEEFWNDPFVGLFGNFYAEEDEQRLDTEEILITDPEYKYDTNDPTLPPPPPIESPSLPNAGFIAPTPPPLPNAGFIAPTPPPLPNAGFIAPTPPPLPNAGIVNPPNAGVKAPPLPNLSVSPPPPPPPPPPMPISDVSAPPLPPASQYSKNLALALESNIYLARKKIADGEMEGDLSVSSTLNHEKKVLSIFYTDIPSNQNKPTMPVPVPPQVSNPVTITSPIIPSPPPAAVSPQASETKTPEQMSMQDKKNKLAGIFGGQQAPRSSPQPVQQAEEEEPVSQSQPSPTKPVELYSPIQPPSIPPQARQVIIPLPKLPSQPEPKSPNSAPTSVPKIPTQPDSTPLKDLPKLPVPSSTHSSVIGSVIFQEDKVEESELFTDRKRRPAGKKFDDLFNSSESNPSAKPSSIGKTRDQIFKYLDQQEEAPQDVLSSQFAKKKESASSSILNLPKLPGLSSEPAVDKKAPSSAATKTRASLFEEEEPAPIRKSKLPVLPSQDSEEPKRPSLLKVGNLPGLPIFTDEPVNPPSITTSSSFREDTKKTQDKRKGLPLIPGIEDEDIDRSPGKLYSESVKEVPRSSITKIPGLPSLPGQDEEDYVPRKSNTDKPNKKLAGLPSLPGQNEEDYVPRKSNTDKTTKKLAGLPSLPGQDEEDYVPRKSNTDKSTKKLAGLPSLPGQDEEDYVPRKSNTDKSTKKLAGLPSLPGQDEDEQLSVTKIPAKKLPGLPSFTGEDEEYISKSPSKKLAGLPSFTVEDKGIASARIPAKKLPGLPSISVEEEGESILPKPKPMKLPGLPAAPARVVDSDSSFSEDEIQPPAKPMPIIPGSRMPQLPKISGSSIDSDISVSKPTKPTTIKKEPSDFESEEEEERNPLFKALDSKKPIIESKESPSKPVPSSASKSVFDFIDEDLPDAKKTQSSLFKDEADTRIKKVKSNEDRPVIFIPSLKNSVAEEPSKPSKSRKPIQSKMTMKQTIFDEDSDSGSPKLASPFQIEKPGNSSPDLSSQSSEESDKQEKGFVPLFGNSGSVFSNKGGSTFQTRKAKPMQFKNVEEDSSPAKKREKKSILASESDEEELFKPLPKGNKLSIFDD
jgi:hypothetical protein